jgi:EmrB/QacA subfamily drug resistance transporter
VEQGNNSRLLLVVVIAGAFMAILDSNIVNVAVPSIRHDLHASFGEVELVVTAYTITYACLLVTGGRLGDLAGRKNMFIAGLVIFTISSAACGAAPSAEVLIAARALQGAGAALFYPQVLAFIQVSFDGEARNRALGVFGASLGLAVVAGQIVGGSLIAANLFDWHWRTVFLVNVPIGVAAVGAAMAWLPAGRTADRPRLDLAGVLVGVAALSCLDVPLLAGRDNGWPAWMIGCLVLAAPLFAGFVAIERRVARGGGRPLVRLDLFHHPGFASGTLIAALFMIVQGGYLFVLSVYLQNGMGFSPLRAGLTFTPAAIAFFAGSLLAPRLTPVLGRSLLAFGYLLAAAGLGGCAVIVAAAGGHLQWWELAPMLALVGGGQGLGFTPLVSTVISGLEPRDAGVSLLFFSLLGTASAPAAVARAFAETLPAVACVYLVTAALVPRLPRGARFSNSLIEREPDWMHGLAYSMFLMTGGRAGDRLFDQMLSGVTERRHRRAAQAPLDPGDFIAFLFEENAAERGWLSYLSREALAFGSDPVPHEARRTAAIQRQVDEIRHRQVTGTIQADLDPTLVRLLAFALASYPRLVPQITRMTTGANVDDAEFSQRWTAFIRQMSRRVFSTERAMS